MLLDQNAETSTWRLLAGSSTLYRTQSIAKQHIPVILDTFGSNSRTTLNTPVPRMNDTEPSGGLDALVEQSEEVLREVRQVLEKPYRSKVATRRLVLKS